ncbi:MAG: DNA-processing protein DprA [Prochlorothrix sp.]|nr:DNA-processing protein DprA [Prochlorothrix sp.]
MDFGLVFENLGYKSGYNVVSGYAKGIDTATHCGALQAEGTTTLVLSLGILNFEARKEFKPWFTATNTLVLSQFAPNAGWFARQAMARNELVCRLAQAVIVIASGPERDDRGRMSGTFAAAKSAFQLGLPVFVISPQALSQPPIGNAHLLELGGIELFPDRTTQQLQDFFHPTPTAPTSPTLSPPTQQLELSFAGWL